MKHGGFLQPLVLLFSCVGVLAQSTNEVIPIFTSDGRTYTNARITSVNAAYAIVMFDGGGKRVKVEELPEPFRSKYYDPKAVEVARNVSEQKKREANERYAETSAALRQAEAWVGEDQKATVLRITGSYGYPKCMIQTTNGQFEAIIIGLPKSVAGYFDELNALNQKSISWSQRATADQLAADEAHARAPAFASGDAAFVQQAQAMIDQAARLQTVAAQSRQQAEDANAQYKALLKQSLSRLRVIVRPTGKVSGGTRLWEYRGNAPLPNEQ